MSDLSRVTGVLWITLAVSIPSLLLSGCVPSYGFSSNRDGDSSRTEFCDSVRSFARAPLDREGLRRAWFLPLGSYEDGSIDFYAPMASDPSDGASKAFYDKKAGQLTHYTTAPQMGVEISKCFTNGFTRKAFDKEEDRMRASFVETRSGRRIEVRAEDDTTSILIASAAWQGDIDEKMRYKCTCKCG